MEPDKGGLLSRAKDYSSIKYALAILETVYLLALLFIFSGFGVSKALTEQLLKLSGDYYFVFPLYLLIISIAYSLLSLPLNFYASYIVEHRFSLSNMTIGDWFRDRFKSGIIAYIIGLIALGAFYYILRLSPGNWWLIVSLFWIFFTMILARLTPVIIIPLFFKYRKLSDEILRKRILNLADKMKVHPAPARRSGVKLLDVFEIDFSRKTLKANAAFMGMGKTRRVILADTLKDKYTHDEIEVILAHEFAHYKLKHLFKLILINSLAAVACFYLIYRSSGYVLGLFGFSSLTDIAALPVVIIYFVLFGIVTQPLTNVISRRLENDADSAALKVTQNKDAFISLMNKLADQNLADRNPHPLIKFYFFDHPPIAERISFAQAS